MTKEQQMDKEIIVNAAAQLKSMVGLGLSVEECTEFVQSLLVDKDKELNHQLGLQRNNFLNLIETLEEENKALQQRNTKLVEEMEAIQGDKHGADLSPFRRERLEQAIEQNTGENTSEKECKGCKHILTSDYFEKDKDKCIMCDTESKPEDAEEKQYTNKQIHSAIMQEYKREFGKSNKNDNERDGYFISGFIKSALDNYKQSLKQK